MKHFHKGEESISIIDLSYSSRFWDKCATRICRSQWKIMHKSPPLIYYMQHNGRGSHEGGLALLQAVTFASSSRLAAETHDEATLVDEVAGDVHGQQEEHEGQHQDPRPQHDAHGERCLVVHICQTGKVRRAGGNSCSHETNASVLLWPPAAPENGKHSPVGCPCLSRHLKPRTVMSLISTTLNATLFESSPF